MDRLVVVSGGITASLVVFLVANTVNPFLSSAYISGGIRGIVVGIAMIIWGKRIGTKKDVEQLR